MISAKNIAFSYTSKTNIFENLSFNITKGHALAILGPNGVGKTTLLRCLMRFLKINQGLIELEGRSVAEFSNKEFWKLISYVPQAKINTFSYSVLDTVLMGAAPYISLGKKPKNKDYEKARSLLHTFKLEKLSDQLSKELSGGQLQLVYIARALMKDPQVIILDEPESNLDMNNQLKVLEVLQDLKKQGITIVINTHYPEHALDVADEALFLGGGNSYAFGPCSEEINEDNLKKYFEVENKIVSATLNNETHYSIISFSK